MSERETSAWWWMLGIFLLAITRDILGESNGCNNTTEGPYNCKCPCSRNRIKKCYFDTSKKIETLCICKEGHQGIHCDKCKNGWHRNGNFSNPMSVCVPCNCTGNLDLSKLNSCDYKTGKCLKCMSKMTGEHCERCAIGFHGDAVVAKNCTWGSSKDYIGSSQGTKHINKETIVIATCSVIGAVCIIAIVYLVYQKHRTRCIKRRIPKFWTVQISNRNYDDMDFSLLDPVTDTPFVYRNDTRDFEEALIADNSPKAQLRIDVDTFTEEFEDTSF